MGLILSSNKSFLSTSFLLGTERPQYGSKSSWSGSQENTSEKPVLLSAQHVPRVRVARGTPGPRGRTRKNPLETPRGEEVQGGHRAGGGSPELGALGAEAPFPGALTRTRGLWSLAPAEVSTSSPGQMTRRAGGKEEEKGKFGQDVRNEPLVRDGEVPSTMKASRPALAGAGPELTWGDRPSPMRLKVRCGGSTKSHSCPQASW